MKKLLLIIGVLVLVIVLAMATLLLFVNPNQFKPLIVEQTKKQTGMDLVIDGDIRWQFFPSIGLSLGRTELKNPKGFKNENVLKIDDIGVDVSIIPLFSKELYIGNVSLNGAEIYLETKKNGVSNLDALSHSNKNEPVDVPISTSLEPTLSEPQTETQNEPWSINLAGISVTNALLEIQDDSTGAYTKLYDVALSVSEFAFNQWTTATFAAKGKNNQQNFSAEGRAELKLSQNFATYALRNITLNARFSDPSTTISSAKVELNTFAFDNDNPLLVYVKGRTADVDIDLTLSSTLFIDKEIEQVRLKNIELNATLVGRSLPQSPMDVTLNSKLGFDVKQSLLSLELNKLNLNNIQMDGTTTVKLNDVPQIRFDLRSPNIDLDAFLGLNQSQSQSVESTTADVAQSEAPLSASKSTASSATKKEVEPDLSLLNMVDVKGKISIDNVKANNVKMQNVVTNLTVKQGVAVLDSFSSSLYQGNIKASAQLDARKGPASYWVRTRVKGVKVQPLLKDIADNDMLEGTGDITLSINGHSLIPTAIKENLSGIVNFYFHDGAINGINVAQLIRVNYAKIKGQKVDVVAKEEKKTDFSEMKATLQLSEGAVTTRDLMISSPLLRIHGDGHANYIKETMDLLLNTSIVGTLKGQGGKDINDLKDITIPVRVYNQWAKPKYKIEFGQLWKQLEKEKKEKLKKKAEKELNRVLGVNNEETKDLADKLLKGLFH